MIGHSLARDGPTRWKVDLTSTACILAASGWASWYRSIGKACVLLACEKCHKLPARWLHLASMKQPLMPVHNVLNLSVYSLPLCTNSQSCWPASKLAEKRHWLRIQTQDAAKYKPATFIKWGDLSNYEGLGEEIISFKYFPIQLCNSNIHKCLSKIHKWWKSVREVGRSGSENLLALSKSSA